MRPRIFTALDRGVSSIKPDETKTSKKIAHQPKPDVKTEKSNKTSAM